MLTKHEENLCEYIDMLEGEIKTLKIKLMKYEEPDEFNAEVYACIETAMQEVMSYTGLTPEMLQVAIKKHYDWI